MFTGDTVANLMWVTGSNWHPRPSLPVCEVSLRGKMLDDILLAQQTGAGELDSKYFSGLLGARLRVRPVHSFDRRGSRAADILWFL